MRNLARVKISKELLETLIPFPLGTKIVGCNTLDSIESPYLTFIVEAENISKKKEGCMFPEVSVIGTNEYGKLSFKFEEK